MKRDQELIKQRERYIKDRINKSKCVSTEVSKISKELFISERTVWRCLK